MIPIWRKSMTRTNMLAPRVAEPTGLGRCIRHATPFMKLPWTKPCIKEQVEHLGTGTYRDAWWFQAANVVYKTTILADPELQFDAKRFTQILTDANIIEALGDAMMHGDFHSPQWFRSGKDTKLNDFNKGHIFTWDGADYCLTERFYDGSYCAPEDLRCEDGNEASDTYSLGNNFYRLLTGMWPHYEYQGEREDLYNMIGKGLKRPYIDPSFYNRSTVEDTLIHLMKVCWEQDLMKRISVFDVLKELYYVRDTSQ
ncbi:hypothetical protein FisN_19Lu259 [Fistulifera solaris]|uniref:Protein kinase domain-containing protein n=1 Tax=Fistulifera solaris TaxID=1519565 RepID=A0A1Z5K8A1_FISSO|nr:hypothetical protein FisN_19Lu259 [Fistulifera solaris]|eukprot:GAX22188.1 hypothetical protein FisN_19Lu259 [Fistulifera solaris]